MNDQIGSKQWESLVGGRWTGGVAGNWFEVRNPANRNEVVGTAPDMDKDDAAGVVQAAADGLKSWRRTSLIERADVLRQIGALIRERHHEIASVVTLEMGKTIRESEGEVVKAADFFEYYASFGRQPCGWILPDARPGAKVFVAREPVGVVLLVTPWNDPVITPSRKLAPALIMGNAVILKPAPESTLSALAYARVIADAGLPAGVLNVACGRDDRVGAAVVECNGYDALSFTGSNEVGLRLRRAVAGRNVRFEAEMGGKNCAVVSASANMEAAVSALVSGAFVQAGQRCTATSRVLVHESLRAELLERVSSATSRLRVGPGMDATSEVGPMVTLERRDHVLGVIGQINGDDSGSVVAGGAPYEEHKCADGNFMLPTVIDGPPQDSRVWCDELFAPVLAVRTFTSIEQAIAEVNSSIYGLSAGIFTNDLAEADQFARSVDAGCVAVNLPTAGWDVHVPFGGFRASGYGQKEQGALGLDFYSRMKTVALKADSGL